jgi:hypothetical protein
MATTPPPPGIHLRRDLYPVILTIPTDDATLGDYEAMLGVFSELYQRGKPFVSIADSRALRIVPSAVIRNRIGEFTKETNELSRACSVANVMIVSNVLIRGAIQALDWVIKPAVPREIVTTTREAFELALRALEKRKVPLSPALIAHVKDLAPDLRIPVY